MAYSKQTWFNTEAGLTALSATRLNYMEDGIANSTPGGGTIIVYASDALDPQGDYVCDGTADEVQILAAINAVLAGPGRGVVQLSEGTFTFSSSGLVLPALGGRVAIRGASCPSPAGVTDFRTKLVMGGSGINPIIDARTNDESLTVSDLCFSQDSTGAANIINLGGSSSIIESCYFRSEITATHRGVESVTAWTQAEVRGCWFDGTSGSCVYLVRPNHAMIVDCLLWSRSQPYIDIVGDGFASPVYSGPYEETFFTVRGCRSWGTYTSPTAISVSNYAADGIISDNFFWYDYATCISLNAVSGIQVISNNIGDLNGPGISLTSADNCIVANNFLFAVFTGHGIHLTDSSDNLVHGNMLGNIGTDVGNTYSGIRLDGDSNDNLVYGNKVDFNPDAGGSLLQYGIRIDDAACDANIVYGNDVKGSYATTGFSDAGTGTVTTASNRS